MNDNPINQENSELADNYIQSAVDILNSSHESVNVGHTNIKSINTVEYPKSVVNVKPKKVRAPRLRSKHPAPTKGSFGNGRKDTRIQNKKTVFIKQFEAEVSKHYSENEKEYKEAGLTYEQVYAIIAQKFIDGELK